MTASPVPHVGMPSEEAILREIQGVMVRDNHAVALLTTQRILTLIRPAFEAKEREIAQLRLEVNEERQTNAISLACWMDKSRRDEAKLAQAVEARETDAIELDDWAYKWLISLRPETDERETYKDGYFYGALHVLGKVRDRARMIADVDAVSIRREAASAAARGETTWAEFR